MRAILMIIILAITMANCRKKKESNTFNIEKKVIEILEQENIINDKSFVFLIGEGMCTECINKEFINLKEQKNLLDKLIVIGIFSNKRYFYSCVNSLNPSKKFFYDLNSIKQKEEITNPLYFIYDKKNRQISNVFIPHPCRSNMTFKYYEVVEEKIYD